jgi:muramoyltetrapeptide carboxypeptidase
VAIWIDPPAWPAHGRLWSHLVSDVSFAELHAFAAASGVPRRGFERDHYDVPAERYDALVARGATPVSSREVIRRLDAAGLRRRKASSMAPRRPGRELLRPPRLRVGDLVGVVGVAGGVAPDRLADGLARMESWGLRVRVERRSFDRRPGLAYLAGPDEDRAAGFTSAWMDSEVAAVMAARGGFGSQRILDLLDWRRLAEASPKVLVGFSDVTALHQAVAGRLGLMTVHGHNVSSLGRADEASAEQLRRLLMEPSSVADLVAGSDADVLSPGRASGVLTGGNLALLAAEVGTSFSRPAAGGIVVLEETGEWPYRIDRLLTQLLRTGWFEGVRGVVLGAFTDCGPSAEVRAVLASRLTPLGVPVVAGLDVGHTTSTISVPFGVAATLDTERAALTLHWG